MKFKNLRIKNFLAIGDSGNIPLKDVGLVLIQGINEDDSSATSNGVGKSSVTDALCWCLYGTTARGESGDSIVNDVAKKDCEVSVIIEDGDHEYSIVRHRKHRSGKNAALVTCKNVTSGANADLSKGTDRETQKVIDSIVGCSIDVFMAAVYAAQEQMPDLPRMTDKQLKMLIEEAAGISRIEEAYKKAMKMQSSVEQLVKMKSEAKLRKQEDMERSTETYNTVRLKFEEFEGSRENLSNELKKDAETRKEALLALGAQIKSYGESELKNRLETISKALSEHVALQERTEELRASLASAERHHDRAADRLATVMTEIKKQKEAFDNAEVSVKKPCSACGRSGDDTEIESYKEHIKKHIAELVEKAKTEREKVAECAESVEAWKGALAAHVALIPDVAALSDESKAINEVLRKLNDLRNKFLREKSEYEAQLKRAEEVLHDANPHASALKLLSDQIEDLKKQISEFDIEIEKAEGELDVCSGVVKAFGPSGVRAHILDTVTPFLNDRTSDYLSALSDGNLHATWTTLTKTAKGELKEKFNIEVTHDKGGKSFKLISGGEKRKVRLATALALQDLVASRASKPIDLWIGDEIDDALDVAGLERLMTILDRKAKERGSVLIVSHNDLKSWVDQSMIVRKSGGSSTVVFS